MIYVRKPIIFALFALIVMTFFPPVYARAPNTVTIPVSHMIEGQNSSSEMFEFAISKVTENAPEPRENSIQINGNGSAEFKIDIDSVGRFDYEIREVEGNNKAIKYDTTVYKIIIAATYNDSGDITTSVILENGTNIKPEEVKFVDRSRNTVSVTPKIQKSIKGDKEYKDKFRFCMKSKNEKKTCSINGAGKTTFPQMTFKKPGVYKYTVYELKDNPSDWKYDTKKYDYTITVVENNGVLEIAESHERMSFTNEPTLLRKAKKVVAKVTGNDDGNNPKNNAKTGDFNHYIRLVAIIGIILFIILIIAAKKRAN